MKTAISIPEPVFKSAERLARKLKVSRSELYVEAIRRYVRDHEGKLVTQKLNEIYSSPDASEVDPAILAASRDMLRRVEW